VLEAATAALAAGATVSAVAAAIRGRAEPTAIGALPAAREEEVLDSTHSSGTTPLASAEAGDG
jgi:hypothetical protein